jgi:hypothetical protein
MYEDLQIDIANKDSLTKWCTELKCSKKDLIDAVLTIGNKAKKVNDFLILNRKKKSDFR